MSGEPVRRERTPLDGPAVLAAAALFLATVGLHGLTWLQYREDPFATRLVADALSYHEWAQRIAEHGIGAEPVFHQAPLFPWLLSWVYRATAPPAHGLWTAVLQGLLLGAATAMLVPLGRAYLGSTAAGAAGGLLVLLHGPFAFYGLKLLPVPLALCTQGAALWLLGRARRGRHATAALAGLAWGVAATARAEVLFLLPVALLALWRTPGEDLRRLARRWLRTAAFLVGLVAAMAPVSWHNLRHGDLVLIASSGGENLFVGNQRGARGGHQPLHPQAGDLFSQRELATVLAEQASGSRLSARAVSRYWAARAWHEIRADPAAWLVLEARKLGRILHPGDPTDIYSFALERSHYLSALYLAPLGAWVLLSLGLAGLWVAWRHQRVRCWPLAACVAVQLLVLLLFFVDVRLRLPLLYCSAPFAGYAVVFAVTMWRERARRGPLVALLTCTVLSTAIGAAATIPTPRDVVRLAAVLSMAGRLDDALAVLEPELGRATPDAYVLDQAGWVLEKRGDLRAARQRYLQALGGGLNPSREAQVRTRLAGVHERLGEIEAARAQFDGAVHSQAGGAVAHFERGNFELRQGRPDAARRDWTEATRLNPRWAAPHEALRSLDASRR